MMAIRPSWNVSVADAIIAAGYAEDAQYADLLVGIEAANERTFLWPRQLACTLAKADLIDHYWIDDCAGAIIPIMRAYSRFKRRQGNLELAPPDAPAVRQRKRRRRKPFVNAPALTPGTALARRAFWSDHLLAQIYAVVAGNYSDNGRKYRLAEQWSVRELTAFAESLPAAVVEVIAAVG